MEQELKQSRQPMEASNTDSQERPQASSLAVSEQQTANPQSSVATESESGVDLHPDIEEEQPQAIDEHPKAPAKKTNRRKNYNKGRLARKKKSKASHAHEEDVASGESKSPSSTCHLSTEQTPSSNDPTVDEQKEQVDKKAIKIGTVAVDSLKPHPDNEKIFRDTSDEEWRALRNSIEAEGQQEPIEALPDGTIISGHRRWRILNELGAEEALVRYRHDLNPQQVRERLIHGNLYRRVLSVGEKARAIKYLYDSAGEQRGGTKSKDALGASLTLEEIGERFALGKRQASTYLSLGNSPTKLQDLVDEEEVRLTIRLASRYNNENMPPETKAKIDDLLENNELQAFKEKKLLNELRQLLGDKKKENPAGKNLPLFENDDPIEAIAPDESEISHEREGLESEQASKIQYSKISSKQVLETLSISLKKLIQTATQLGWEAPDDGWETEMWSFEEISFVEAHISLKQLINEIISTKGSAWLKQMRKLRNGELPDQLGLGDDYALTLPTEKIRKELSANWPIETASD